MKDKWDIFDADAPNSLMEGVLEKTSGGVCDSAEVQLPDFVDGALKDANSHLVTMHLDGCDTCRALERALSQLSVDLETLRELSPSPGFAKEVIRSTSDRLRVVQGLAAIWRRLVSRPRFAYEFAYLGTVALVLVFWLAGGENMREVAYGLTRDVPAVSDDWIKSTTNETVKFTGAIKTKVSLGVKTGVESGQVLVGENAEAIVRRTSLVSDWTRDRWTGLARRLKPSSKEEINENQRRSNHD